MEGVGPFVCEGTLQTIGEYVQLPAGQKRQVFVLQVGTQQLLFEAYDEVAAFIRGSQVGAPIRVRFVVRGWRWYPPQGESRYILRLTALQIEPASS
jgi:hypothetical protein